MTSVSPAGAPGLRRRVLPRIWATLFACAVSVLLVVGQPAVVAQGVGTNSTSTNSSANVTTGFTSATANSTATAIGGNSTTTIVSSPTKSFTFDLGSASVAILGLVLLGLAAALALLARWTLPRTGGQR